MPPLRAQLVLLHRYAGLVMAAFLVLAGLTGAPLAWYYELDAAINGPWLRVVPPGADAVPLSPWVLRERVRQRYPRADVNTVPLVQDRHASAVFFIEGSVDPATGRRTPLEADEIFVDPYRGEILGGRRWGDIRQGWPNLMPFIYRLHHELAAGKAGAYALGLVALLWTLDCFVGAALTLPSGGTASRGVWWRRWRRAWHLRAGHGTYKLNVDLHRAGGLWLWAWLFVFAWSGVAFNLHEAYDPVMHALFDSQEARPATDTGTRPVAADAPAMGWPGGLAQGRELMQALSKERGFQVLHEQRLSYRPRSGVFHYRVRSDRDIRDRRATTSIDFDAATGRPLASFVPTGEAAGDTLTSWMLALHMADVWGQPFKLAVCLLGLATAALSGTGVWIWWRKRRGRLAARRNMR